MKTDDKNLMGVVVEVYDHDASHRILVVQSNDSPNVYQFFYISKTPEVNFGDIIQMNFADDKFHVCRGNSKLSYKITPLVFPGSLLMELITERMNL